MKKMILITMAASALLSTPAIAEPAAAIFNWTGFYVGAVGGYAEKQNGFDWSPESPLVKGRVDGWSAGGIVGYNWQVGKSVVGLEGDWSWANINGSKATLQCSAFAGEFCEAKISDFETARGRIGVLTTPNVLLFATGGAAWGRVARGAYGTTINLDVWKDRAGWTLGGGLEWMFAPNWTMKAEYLYIDLGSALYPTAGALTGGHENTSFNVVRLGLNYKFGN